MGMEIYKLTGMGQLGMYKDPLLQVSAVKLLMLLMLLMVVALDAVR